MCLYHVCAKRSFALLNWLGTIILLSESHIKKDAYVQKIMRTKLKLVQGTPEFFSKS